MRAPRGLSREEAAAWEKLAATVTPLAPRAVTNAVRAAAMAEASAPPPRPPAKLAKPASPRRSPVKLPEPPKPEPLDGGLDSHWERRMKGGGVQPDFTLDLHGHTLDSAHGRLDSGLAQARAMGARVVLLIAGKPRPVAAADRAERRGAIRAKLLDWLAAGPHAGAIAAIRPAHRRHGGEGAVYLILRKPR